MVYRPLLNPDTTCLFSSTSSYHWKWVLGYQSGPQVLKSNGELRWGLEAPVWFSDRRKGATGWNAKQQERTCNASFLTVALSTMQSLSFIGKAFPIPSLRVQVNGWYVNMLRSISFVLMWMFVSPYMYTWVQVPGEAKQGCQLPRSWSYRWVGAEPLYHYVDHGSPTPVL